MREPSLERSLQELAAEIDYPPTPALASAVTARLTREPVPMPRAGGAWLRPVIAVAAIAVAIAMTLVFSPTLRRAAADLLGVIGIEISVGGAPEAPDISDPSPVDIQLGQRVSVATAESVVGFEVLGKHAMLGPSRVYLDRSIGDSGMVSTVFYPPEDPEEIAFLITEFRASVEEGFFKKVSAMEGEVTFAEVRDSAAYWLSGEPHLFYYVDSDGRYREETVRLAGNVLLWEEDGVTYRIEGADSLAQALDIASDLR